MTIPFAIEIANVSIAKPTAIRNNVSISMIASMLTCIALRIHRYNLASQLQCNSLGCALLSLGEFVPERCEFCFASRNFSSWINYDCVRRKEGDKCLGVTPRFQATSYSCASPRMLASSFNRSVRFTILFFFMRDVIASIFILCLLKSFDELVYIESF